MIGISMLRFPAGTRGSDIDAVARSRLWKAGLDYAHGTGHGVGSYLSVHEGPQRIAKTGTREAAGRHDPVQRAGLLQARAHYGIRIENLILVRRPSRCRAATSPMHGFETLTLAPFDRRLIDTALLTRDELRLARRLPRPRAGRDRADGRRRDADMAGRGDRAVRHTMAKKRLSPHD